MVHFKILCFDGSGKHKVILGVQVLLRELNPLPPIS